MHKILMEIKYQVRFGAPVWLVMLFFSWLPDMGPIMRLRGLLVSFFMPGFPKGLSIASGVTLLSIDKLKLGENVYIGRGAWVNAIGGIHISDEVMIAPYVVMSSNNHGFKDGSVRFGGGHPAPIYIGRGTWLAAHSVICAGVKVGAGNLVAANSVVASNTDDDCVIAGVPGKRIKDRIDNPSEITSKHQVL